MCEQTEINYLDGDVVWVKLGSYWWPGQVVGSEKLPEDIQIEFKNKPLIATVKFFQEDSFEFVKNYQQIYKYNCTQKEDFIRKGLDKYRAKCKEGSNYMDKFPEDVKTAETLTNGDPNILLNEKYNPEEKPDISGLFGEKKISKKRRNRDDLLKRSDDLRKVTHPRFLNENDHEIRIRQQPQNLALSSLNSSLGGIYPCHICGFTAMRVNVIICHLKNHRLNNETASTIKSKLKTNTLKIKQSNSPKRKYSRKSVSNKVKNESSLDSGKRKSPKQLEKPNKKKKSDPELKEKLLADWNVDSDDDEPINFRKIVEVNTETLSIKSEIESKDNFKNNIDVTNLIQETNKLLQETNSITDISLTKDTSSKSEKLNLQIRFNENKDEETFYVEKSNTQCELQDKDDKKSRLSCFDFEEDDVPETNISVRKIPRNLGNKNISIKKEFIKAFELSQALKFDTEKEIKNEVYDKLNIEKNADPKRLEKNVQITQDVDNKIKQNDEINRSKKDETFEKPMEICETQVEILEIFEVEKDEASNSKEENAIEKLKLNYNDYVEINIKHDKAAEKKMEDYSTIIINQENIIAEEDTKVIEEKLFAQSDSENKLVENDHKVKELFLDATESNKFDLSKSCNSRLLEDESFFVLKNKKMGTCEKSLLEDNQVPLSSNLTEEVKDNFLIEESNTVLLNDNGNSNSILSSISKKQRFGIRKDEQIIEKEIKDNKHSKFESVQKTKNYLDSKCEINDQSEKKKNDMMKDQALKETDKNTDLRANEGLKSFLEHTSTTNVKDNFRDNISINNTEAKEMLPEKHSILGTSEIAKRDKEESVSFTGNRKNVEELENIRTVEMKETDQNNEFCLLPPKKIKIKKFEISQIESDVKPSGKTTNLNSSYDLSSNTDNANLKESKKLLDDPLSEMPKFTQEAIICDKRLKEEEECCVNAIVKDIKESNDEKWKTAIQISEKGTSENNQFDSFQDAFVKTLQIENSSKLENTSDESNSGTENVDSIESKNIFLTKPESSNHDSNMKKIVTSDNTNIKLIISKNTEIDIKASDITSINDNSMIQSCSDDKLSIKKTNVETIQDNSSDKINENCQKINKITNPILIDDVKVTVPVKKREKPRIIENIALKEPVILKTKLMEKYTGKVGKHKLESNNLMFNESKNFPRTKVMKMDTVFHTAKNKLPMASTNKKELKAFMTTKDLSTSSIVRLKNDQKSISLSTAEIPEKYVQGSSESLVEMELDINSMPFVLSEDILTPESIEQMPVVISSVLPTSNPVTTLSNKITTLISPTKQTVAVNKILSSPNELKELNKKKKFGTPAILKNKNKIKPIVTNIKAIMPSLASGIYKESCKMNAQTMKASLCNQKTPGKYVIVQTSGHQQAFSTHQNMNIPSSKGSGNAQIVQKGSKVVILTSAQSGQATQKILPFHSITKALSNGKAQKIMHTKQSQICTSISSQNFASSKTVLIPKNKDSSTTSKGSYSKISDNQLIASKTVSSQIPETVAKSTSLGDLSQDILSKDTIFAPISTSTSISTGKTVINSLVSKSIATAKSILSPINQSFSTKSIINSQGFVSKGTVLTPITGSQVKALAAKSIKTSKIQYQTIQPKVPTTETQKNPKSTISPPIKASTNVKSSSNVIVLQNTDLKPQNKKSLKQVTGQKLNKLNDISAHSGHTDLINTKQKIDNPKILNRSIKIQQKIPLEKHHVKLKKLILNDSSPMQIKTSEPTKQVEFAPITKSRKGSNKGTQNKTCSVINSATLSTPPNLSTFSEMRASELSSQEKISKNEILKETTLKEDFQIPNFPCVLTNEMDKTEEAKISAQAQIMALPTENSDGTQTYVLVTVDDHGNIIPLGNNALMSLDDSSNFDESRTVYVNSNTFNESGNADSIVLQIDNTSLSNLQTISPELTSTATSQTLPHSEISQTVNRDILAAALANTDFQQEINATETTESMSMTSITQTSLINQTILQSTIIPPTEPISSPLVLETSLTLNQPIMTPLEVPSNLSIQTDLTPVTAITTIPTSLELSINSLNQSISYVTNNSMPKIEETIEISSAKKSHEIKIPLNVERAINSNLIENVANQPIVSDSKSNANTYSTSIPANNYSNVEMTSSMPIINDNFNISNDFDITNICVPGRNNLLNFTDKSSDKLTNLTENNSSQINESFHQKCATNKRMLGSPEIIIDNNQIDCISSKESIISDYAEPRENFLIEKNKYANKVNSNNSINEEEGAISCKSYDDMQSSNQESGNQSKESPTLLNQSSTRTNEKSLKITSDKEIKVKSSELQPEQIIRENINSLSQIENHVKENCELILKEKITETKQEDPSQSYFINKSNDVEFSEQSAEGESLQKATQSFIYKPHVVGDHTIIEESPSQSYQDSKQNKGMQSSIVLHEININVDSQSLSEIIKGKEIETESLDGPNFPTQSYNIEKIGNFEENVEIDTEVSQEGNVPSQSNDIIVDGIGTSSIITHNSCLNEDETASSSYVPETPENQERDQDQESAISTSSYEIPPCEELNIASSSVIPDTSIQSEHSNIRNKSLLEITTSSYSLNPDSSSTHIDAVPTSSYEDELVIEQSVSTSYEIPISMSNLEDASSQNYVSDSSSNNKNVPTSYFSPHEEVVSESYYENICKHSDSQIEVNSEEEATPSYYESNSMEATQEASQSYLNQEEVTPSYSSRDVSPSFYDPRTDHEASQSYYSPRRSNESILQNVETTTSFYDENVTDERLNQGEAVSSYNDNYSLDYNPVDSPLDRHNLVESSMPRPTDR